MLCLMVGVINLFCGCQTTRQRTADGMLIATERHLKTGDLLFAFDPRGNAITAVTSGVQGLKIDHVGIVLKDKKQVVVAEATSRKGVILTPLAEFLTHNTIPGDRYPSVVRGRLKTNFDEAVLRTRVNHYLGLPYDSLYMPDVVSSCRNVMFQRVERLCFRQFPCHFMMRMGRLHLIGRPFMHSDTRQFQRECRAQIPVNSHGIAS